MENNLLKTNEEIRNQLLTIKDFVNIFHSDRKSQDIADKIADLNREKLSIVSDTHGDKVNYCHEVIDKVINSLQNNLYSSMLKEAQKKIKMHILSLRLDRYKKMAAA